MTESANPALYRGTLAQAKDAAARRQWSRVRELSAELAPAADRLVGDRAVAVLRGGSRPVANELLAWFALNCTHGLPDALTLFLGIADALYRPLLRAARVIGQPPPARAAGPGGTTPHPGEPTTSTPDDQARARARRLVAQAESFERLRTSEPREAHLVLLSEFAGRDPDEVTQLLGHPDRAAVLRRLDLIKQFALAAPKE
jgi:hypothetical protein